MKKRLLITFLAIALILGALGINALAETSQSTPDKVAVVSWAETVPTLDGETKEQSWIMSSTVKGAAGTPAGTFGKLWNGENLYLAVNTGGASSMSITLNGKTATVDLTAATAVVSGMENVQAAKKGSTVELKIPFASFGFVLGNYGQTIPMELSLTGATGTSSFSGDLEFTAQEVQASQGTITNTTITNAITGYYGSYNSAAKTNGQVGNESIKNADGSYTHHMWNIYQENKTNYAVQGIYAYTDTAIANALKKPGLLTVDFDLQIDDMPEYTNPTSGNNIWRQYDPAGIAFSIARNIAEENIKLSFTNLKGVGLVLYVGHGPLLSSSQYGSSAVDTIQWDGPYKLNKEMGEKFHVTMYYRENGEIAVYADDEEVFPWKDMGADFVNGGSAPNAYLNFTLWSAYYHPTASKVVPGISDFLTNKSVPKNSGANSDVYVSNIKVGQVSSESLMDTLTFDTIKGNNTDPQFISSDLILPPELTDGKLTANLQWTSSEPGVIGNDGKFNPPEAFTDVVLTATVPGTNIKKTFNLTVVMPVMDAWKADSVTVDGNLSEYYDFARGYVFEAEAGKPSGKIAARFTKDTLYLGAEYTNSNILAFQLNEKIIIADLSAKTVDLEGAAIAVADGKAELALPLSALELNITKGMSKALGVIFANDTAEIGKTLLLGFYGVAEADDISFAGTGITIDGKLNEADWRLTAATSGREGAPTGLLGQLWSDRDLYLAIDVADATALRLKIAGNTVEIADLANVPASSGVATEIAKDGNVVEMKIPFGDFYNLYNYGQTMPVELELENAKGVSGFYGDLVFSSWKLENKAGSINNQITNAATQYGTYNPNAQTTGQTGFKQVSDGRTTTYHMWNIYQENETNYAVQGIYGNPTSATSNALKAEGMLSVKFDLQIDDMPEYTDPTSGWNIWRRNHPAGLGLSLSRGIFGEDIRLSFTNLKDQGLVLYVGHGPMLSAGLYGGGMNTYDVPQWAGPYKLGKELGQKFDVEILYTEEGEMAVYVDDAEIFALKDMGANFSYGSTTASAYMQFVLWSPYYNTNDSRRPAGIDEIFNPDSSPKNSGANSDVYISNLVIGSLTSDDILDNLTFDTIKGLNGSESTVVRDLELPATVTDGRLVSNLTWKSSNENVVGTDGKVYTQDQNTRVTLSAELTGSNPVQKKSFNLMVNTPVMDAWYGSENHFDRGYTFPAVAGKPSGSIAARWDDKNLYLSANTVDATKFVVTVGGKTYTADVSGDKATITVPLSAIGAIEKNFSTPASLSLTGEGGSVSKTVALCFFGVPSLRNASWHDGKITVDGALTEGDWKLYSKLIGRPGSPEGAVGALWNGTDLYLAVQTGDATRLNLKLNGKAATIDLATLVVSGMDNVTVKKNGSDVELKIPFASFDFALQNYTQTMAFTVELENAAGVSGYEGPLGFSSLEHKASGGVSSQEITNIVPNMYGGITTDQMKADITAARNSGQTGYTATNDAYGNTTFHMWNKYQEGVKNYAIQGIYSRTNVGSALSGITGIATAEFDLKIDEMPMYKEPWRGDQIWRTCEPAGLGITMYRGIAGEDLKMGISRTSDGIVLYVGYTTNKDYGSGTVVWDGPYKLGVELGQEFHVSIHYTNEGELALYVDDQIVYEFKEVGYPFSSSTPGAGLNFTVWTPYYNAELNADIINPDSSIKNAGANTDLYISNVKVGEITAYDLLDSLTFDTIRGQNGSEHSIMKDLMLIPTLSDGNKLSANLTWSSSNTSIIATNGKVTTGKTDTPVTVTATLTGTNLSKSFDLIVALPAVDAWRADSVNVNGTLAEYYDFTRGYTFAPEAGKPDGSIGIRWNKNTLYIGAKVANTDKLTVTLGGKTIVADLTAKKVSGVNGASIAVGEGTVELGIPMSSLSLGTITEGLNKPMNVALSKGSIKVQKDIGLHFFGVQITRNVQWNDGTIAIDGVLEGDWMMYPEFNGRAGSPEGGFARMWNGTNLYLAVDTDGADKLFVTVSGRTAVIDLTAADLTDSTGLIQKIAKQGDIVEMQISFKDFFTLSNYGQTIPVAVEAQNEVAASGIHTNLAFSAQEYEASSNALQSLQITTIVPNMYGYGTDADAGTRSAADVKQAEKNGQVGNTTTVDENGNATYHVWNKYLEGQKNYAVQGVHLGMSGADTLAAIEGTASIDFDLQIDDMPEYIEPWRGDQIWRTLSPAGLGINISRGIVGENLKLGISNTKEGLVLYVGYGPTTKEYGSGTVQWDGPHKLGVKLGEKFHMSLHYTEDGQLAVYVNDSVIYAFKEVGYDFSGSGTANPNMQFVLYTPYYNEELNAHILNPDSTPKNAGYSTDLYISNVKLGNVSAYDLFDNLSFDDIKGTNGSEDTLVSNLTLPTKLSDGKISTTIKWTSSNTAALSGTGRVTAQDVRTPVVLTATLAGTNITKKFNLTVTLPYLDAWQANFVKIDGDLSEYFGLDRGYTFPKASGKPSGSVAALWNLEKDRLYFAVKYTNATKMKITMGSRTVEVDIANQTATGGGGVKNVQMKTGKDTLEISLPLSRLWLEEIKIGDVLDITVQMENEKTSVYKNLQMCFYGTPGYAQVAWNKGDVVIDGRLDEPDWQTYTQIQGRSGAPIGTFGELWNGKNLYLAVNTDGAKTMSLYLNGKTATINLSKATPTVNGIKNVKIAKSGDSVEMRIPFDSIGLNLVNYTQSIEMKIELSNSVGTSGFNGSMYFASRQYHSNVLGEPTQSINNNVDVYYGGAENVENAKKSGQVGTTFTVDENGGYTYRMWNKYMEGQKNYSVQFMTTSLTHLATEALETIQDTLTVDFDVQIDDMAEYIEPTNGNSFWRQYSIPGLAVSLGRNILNEEVTLSFTNMLDYGLVLYVGTGPFTKTYGSDTVQWDGPYQIDKELGQKFHVSVHYTTEGEVAVYVDDYQFYNFSDRGANFPAVPDLNLSFSVHYPFYALELTDQILDSNSAPKNSDFDTDVYVSNVQLGTSDCYDLMDLLDFDTFKKNNGSVNTINTDLSLPTKLTDGKLSGTLVWESKKEDVITTTGKVTTGKKDTNVILTATLKDSNPLQKEEYELTVILPYMDTWYGSATLDGKVDEYHDFDRGYTFVKEKGKPTGSVAARWDEKNLYLAGKFENADSLTIEVGKKTLKADLVNKTVDMKEAQIAVGKNTVEIIIPRDKLGIADQVNGDHADMLVGYHKGDVTTEKWVRMTFYGGFETGYVGWGDQITVDGAVTETAWQLYGKTTGREGTPEGLVGKLWSGDSLYLAVYPADAHTMIVTVGGKSTTIKLNNLRDSTGLISRMVRGSYIHQDVIPNLLDENETPEHIKVNGSVVEMKIPFANFGFDLYNYGLTTDVSVELISNAGASSYAATLEYTNVNWKNYLVKMGQEDRMNSQLGNSSLDRGVTSGQLGIEQIELETGKYSYRLWNRFMSGVNVACPNMWVQSSSSAGKPYADMHHPEDTFQMDCDIRIDDMPEYPDVQHYIASYGVDGITFYIGRGIENQELQFGISNVRRDPKTGHKGFVLAIYHIPSGEWISTPIYIEKYESFHLTAQIAQNGDLTVYIDDQLVTVCEGAAGDYNPDSAWPTDRFTVWMNEDQTWSTPASADHNSDFTISNVTVGTVDDDTIMDYLLFNDFMAPNRRDNAVWQNMTLPKTVTDGRLSSAIVWTSSNESAIKIENGIAKVTPQDKDTEVILTATLAGDSKITKQFKVIVTPQIVDADINKYANSGTMTGGSVQAKWNKESITFAIAHNGADTVNLTVGDKKAEVILATSAVTGIEGAKATVKGNTVEVTLPRSALGIEIKEYHQTQAFTVETVKGGNAIAAKNFKVEFVGFESIIEEYQKSKALSDFAASIKTITDHVNIPTTFQSAYLDASANLTWESDTPKVLSGEGKLNAPAKVGLNVKLTFFVNGTQAGNVTGYVKAKGMPDVQSTARVQAAFVDKVKIDGSLSEQWSLNNNIAKGEKIIGKMGAMWDTEYLYLAFQTGSAKTLNLNIEGKTAQLSLGGKPTGDLKIADMARNGKYLELKIAMKDIGLAKIEDYGDELKTSIMLDEGKFEGTLVLSSIQYFITDKPNTRLIMSSSDAISYDHVGWAETANGYNLYAKYAPGAENLAAQTMGIGFNHTTKAGTEIYEPMGESGIKGVYVEFDFQANYMPAYTGEEDIQGSHINLGTNGFNWTINGNIENKDKQAEWLQGGIFNNGDRLVLVHRFARYEFDKIPLDKSLGDKFRIGIAWNADDSLDFFIDGELIYHTDRTCHYTGAPGSKKPGVSFRLQRSADAAARDYDGMDVNIENLAMGNFYGECLVENMDFNTIRQQNINEYAIIYDLDLMTKYAGEQITSGKLTWTSSDESVISNTGKVTRPEVGYEAVYLTVTNDLGHSQDMTVVVKGLQNADDVLYVNRDYNPAGLSGVPMIEGVFALDKNSPSIIKDLKEVEKVNVIRLTELDNYGRLYEDMLSLWVSDDNVTYTEIDDFKLLHKDNKWYIYDFEAEARYIKVHCTHFDTYEYDVIGVSSDMIDVYFEETFGAGEGDFGTTKTVTVKNSSKNNRIDWTWSFTPQELGIVSLTDDLADIRVMQGDNYLYHYVEDGMVHIRIPEIKAGGKTKIKVLSGNKDAMDISNKENTLEILYGTKEFYTDYNYNWTGYEDEYLPFSTMVTTNDGTIINTAISRSQEGYCREQVYSKDGGRTWQGLKTLDEFDPIAHPGGFVYDSVADVVWAWGYKEVAGENGMERIMHILKLDMAPGIENAEWEYICEFAPDIRQYSDPQKASYENYNNGIMLSCYDGEGPNVDMLIPFHSGERNDNAIAGARTLYTTDAGKNWVLSESFTSYESMIGQVDLGFEFGVSESCVQELEGGTVVKLSRNQSSETVSFAYSYSTDYGVTWTEVPIQSQVWSPNTQPMFNESYDDEVDVLMWAGNNLMGGASYWRQPVVLAQLDASPENCGVMGVQYPYNRTYMQAQLENVTRSTNIHDTRTKDGDLIMFLGEGGRQAGNAGIMRINDIHEYMTKTKGAYDSFENDSVKYDGWSVVKGMSSIDDEKSTQGEASMKTYGMVVRGVTSFSYGSVSADLYWNEGKRIQFELASAHIDEEDTAAAAKFTVNHDGSVSVDGVDTGLKFQDGWNSFNLEVDLPGGIANLTVNGSEPAALATNDEYGAYCAYIRIHSDAFVWVDNLAQIGEEDILVQDKTGFLETEEESGTALTVVLAIGIPALVIVAIVVAVIFGKKKLGVSKNSQDTESNE